GLQFDRHVWRYLLRESSPILLANLSANFTLRGDSVMLGVLRGAQETGIYGAAYNVLLAVGSISASFLNAAFPTISKVHVADLSRSKTLFYRLFAGYGIASVLVSIVIGTFADRIVQLLYGDNFVASGQPLRILG